jgi:hypothetical protein
MLHEIKCEYCKKIHNDIKLLIEEYEIGDNALALKIKELLIRYSIDNDKNKNVCPKPIIDLYHRYYPDNIETSTIKICDLIFKFVQYENTQDFKLRDEIKIKMMFMAIYELNIEIFNSNIFSDVSIKFECEKHSIIFKHCKDTFTKDISKISNTKISHNNKYRLHDCLMTIKHNDKMRQIGFEFNEKNHIKEYDDLRESTSKIPLLSLHIRKQNDKRPIKENFKEILNDIVYNTCYLTKNKGFIAKLLMYDDNMSDDTYDTLETLIKCVEKDIFEFNMFISLFRIPCHNQDEVKSMLIEQEILNDDDENDSNKITYSTDAEDNYYVDNVRFERLLLSLTVDFSLGYKTVLELYLKSVRSLMSASDKIIDVEGENRLEHDNISGFIDEITYKPIKEVLEKKDKELYRLECYDILFDKLNIKNHTSKRLLPYIHYDKDNTIEQKELDALGIVLGPNYISKLKKTISELNNTSNNKIRFKFEKDNISQMQIKYARIDYDLFRKHHIKN